MIISLPQCCFAGCSRFRITFDQICLACVLLCKKTKCFSSLLNHLLELLPSGRRNR